MDPLDLVERELIIRPVIELRGAGRLMPGDLRGRLQLPAVSQVFGDAGTTQTVITNLSR